MDYSITISSWITFKCLKELNEGGNIVRRNVVVYAISLMLVVLLSTVVV